MVKIIKTNYLKPISNYQTEHDLHIECVGDRNNSQLNLTNLRSKAVVRSNCNIPQRERIPAFKNLQY